MISVSSAMVLLGFSVRMSGNRLKEGINKALYSALTAGIMNATTNNQSTHCLIITGLTNLKVDSGNKVLIQLGGNDNYCNPFTIVRDYY